MSHPSCGPERDYHDHSEPDLAETLDILQDPDLVIAIDEGMSAVAAEDFVSLEEFRRIVTEQRGQESDNA